MAEMSDRSVDDLLIYSASLFMKIVGFAELLISLPMLFDLPFKIQILPVPFIGLTGVLAGFLVQKRKRWKITFISAVLLNIPSVGLLTYLVWLGGKGIPDYQLYTFGFIFLIVGAFPAVTLLETRRLFLVKR